MLPKPGHLGPAYAAQFGDESVAAAYPHRPPYPAEVFAVLARLVTATPRAVLDAGCGTGDIARNLVELVDRIDAVDPSAAMLARGRALPGGDHPRLRWVRGPIEAAPLEPPYALVTAGESLHWMEWSVALPRLRAALVSDGFLAIVGRDTPGLPWAADLLNLIRRYTTNREYRPYNLIAELAQRDLFRTAGDQRTAPVSFRQPLAGYVESIHSRNGFSRERMTADAAAAFDVAVAALLAPYCDAEGMVPMAVVGHVTWGAPADAR